MIRPFDPWRSPLCTCPPKWTVNPYTGCGHRCLYCYASSYIRRFFEPRVKQHLIENALRDLKMIPEESVIELSASSDPLQPLESTHRLTLRLLSLLLSRGYRILLTTKAPNILLEYIDLIEKFKDRIALAVTVTTIDDKIAKTLEPGAPPPSLRLEAVRILASRRIPVTIRLDPIIPLVNSSYESIHSVVAQASIAGAIQITCSTYKVKPDNFKRLINAYPELREELYRLYYIEGELIHGYRYLSRKLRIEIIRRVEEAASTHGLAFATCREGVYYRRGVVCDGSGPIREASNKA